MGLLLTDSALGLRQQGRAAGRFWTMYGWEVAEELNLRRTDTKKKKKKKKGTTAHRCGTPVFTTTLYITIPSPDQTKRDIRH